MLDAVRAEALKMRRHRATWLMVWVYPIVITLLVIAFLIHGLIAAAPDGPATAQPAAAWVHDSALIWKAPASSFGRFLIAGFTALVFAGEYGWNTWKLVIPARARWQLIAAKWAVVFGFTLLAVIAADAIGLIGDWLTSLQDGSMPAGVTIGAIVLAHAAACGHALLPIAYTIAFAALFAILTRSILAALILSIAMIVVEGLLPLLALFAYAHAPALTLALVKGLPLYHLSNLMDWSNGSGLMLPLGPTIVQVAWGTSLAVVLAWIAAAGAGTMLSFMRQDLN
jgi:ABC-2 type transport system permease protein